MDSLKEEVCKNNGCKLFRIRDTYSEEEFNKLIENIKNIINTVKV